MLQRVGLAQALINDPEVVFLDEPMSGLDPLGRRDVRALILRLRDRGRTVFFSSHVLSDAEALCSRVAIVAKGRLVAVGPLAELVDVRSSSGWELVVGGLPQRRLRAHARPRARRSRPIAAGRYALDAAAEPSTRAAAARSSPRRRRSSSRSTRCATRSRICSFVASQVRAAPTARRGRPMSAMRAVCSRRRQRLQGIGARQGALQPRRCSRCCSSRRRS